MITPKVESFYRRIKSVAISINLRKWRFFLPFLKRPSVYNEVSLFIKNLNRLLGNDILINKPSTDSLKECAEQAMHHEITVLGSPIRSYENMPWHEDIKSGKVWKPGKYFRDYVQIDVSDSSDVKVPWEISRCHHLLYLGQAYMFTKDEKYANEIVDQINDWIDSNPLMYSINWTCSMEVAIRAVNWIWAINLISDSAAITDDFVIKVSKSFYEHGFYIYNNIEDAEQHNGNHLISDLVGLIYIGALLKENKKAQTWYMYAKNALYNEIRTQFLPSGFHYERSLAYHGLVTEMIGHTISLMERTGESIPLDILYRVALMQQVIEKVKKNNGLLPNIADNDDGHFLPFIKMPVFGKKKQKFMGTEIYPDVGFAVHRSDKYYLFVSNSGISKYPEKGQFNTAHTHCDLLSFELSLGGTDFVIDAGTCNYTGNLEKRDEFRSTKKHNTIQIDDIEQFRFERNKPFQLFDDVQIEPLSLKEVENTGIIIGSYYFERDGVQVDHLRGFECQDDCVIIKDKVGCAGHHQLALRFHLAPGIECIQEHEKYILAANDQRVSVESASMLNGHLLEDTISEQYGTEKISKTLSFNGVFDDEISIVTKFKLLT